MGQLGHVGHEARLIACALGSAEFVDAQHKRARACSRLVLDCTSALLP